VGLGLDRATHRVRARSAGPFVELGDVAIDVAEIVLEHRLTEKRADGHGGHPRHMCERDAVRSGDVLGEAQPCPTGMTLVVRPTQMSLVSGQAVAPLRAETRKADVTMLLAG
jgi:hypothetical protein